MVPCACGTRLIGRFKDIGECGTCSKRSGTFTPSTPQPGLCACGTKLTGQFKEIGKCATCSKQSGRYTPKTPDLGPRSEFQDSPAARAGYRPTPTRLFKEDDCNQQQRQREQRAREWEAAPLALLGAFCAFWVITSLLDAFCAFLVTVERLLYNLGHCLAQLGVFCTFCALMYFVGALLWAFCAFLSAAWKRERERERENDREAASIRQSIPPCTPRRATAKVSDQQSARDAPNSYNECVACQDQVSTDAPARQGPRPSTAKSAFTFFPCFSLRRQQLEQPCQGRPSEQEVLHLLGRGGPCEISVNLVVSITDNFSDEKKLGEGAFGDVYEGVVEDTGNQKPVRVAVKRLKPSIRLQGDATEHRAALTSIKREIHVLGRFYHPNIIRLLGFTSINAGTAQELCLIYELGQNGSLDKMLVVDSKLAQDLSCKLRVRIAAGVSRALNYLHCHDPRGPAFHRDVKSANIVLDLGLRPKLIDCGLSKFIPEQNRLGTIMSTHGAALGTPGYMCPAYQRTLHFEAKSEIYSFGMVLLELMTGRIQGYQGLDENDLFAVYIDDERSVLSALDTRAGTWSTTCAEQMEALARECLAPHRRRIGTMLAVMRRLVDLEKQCCLATDEERRMQRLAEDLQRELDALRHKGVLAEQLERKVREQAAELIVLREREKQAQTRREREDQDRADRLRQCFVCFDEVDVDAGVECRTGHFMCAVCLNEEVKTQVSMENFGAFKKAKLCIKCRHHECSGDSWLDIAALTRHLAEDGFRSYLGAREAVQVGEALQEQEERHNKKVKELEEQMQKLAVGRDFAVLQARKKIIEDILTLKCPRQHCRRAFVDFDACFALTCGACTCAFCAYCLEDCGRDAHSHVANCQYNITPGKGVFASVEVFERAQRVRRTRLLKEHLAHHVEPGVRGALIEAMQRDLADLGIDGAQLLPFEPSF